MTPTLWFGRAVLLLGLAVPFLVFSNWFFLPLIPAVILGIPLFLRESRRRIESDSGRLALAASLLWVLSAGLSSFLADEFQSEAFLSVGIFFLIPVLCDSVQHWLSLERQSANSLVRALALGSLCAFGLRLAESSGLLGAGVGAGFEEGSTWLAGFEVLFPLGFVLILEEPRWFWKGIGGALLLVGQLSILFAPEHVGLLVLSFAIPLVLLVASISMAPTRWARALLALLVCFTLASVLWLAAGPRTIAESRYSFGANYVAPESVEGPVGASFRTRIVLQNVGRTTWSPSSQAHLLRASGAAGLPVPETLLLSLSGRWLSEDGTSELHPEDIGAELLSFSLPQVVEPGDTTSVGVNAKLPHRSGRYLLSFGLASAEGVVLQDSGSPEAEVPVIVRPAEDSLASVGKAPSNIRRTENRRRPKQAITRADREYAALELVRTRPVLGIGPGTLPLLLGRPLGRELSASDSKELSLYLRMLSEQGLVGLGLFVLWMAALLRESKFCKDPFRFAGFFSVSIFLFRFLAFGDLSQPSTASLFALCLAFMTSGTNHEE